MKQFLITMAGVLVGLLLFAIALPVTIIGLAAVASRPSPPPENTVLVLDLRGGLTDQPSSSPFAFLRGKSLSVIGVEQTLRRAETDDRVKALFVRLPEGGMAPAAADELRLAFKRFRAAGKPIMAHAQGLYADGLVTSTYELAAASGDVWLQPASAFQVTGIARGDVFFKRFFDRHQVIADYEQRYEYKNAVNPYLYDDYTPAHRQGELSWMGSVYDTAVADVAADRGRTAAEIKTLLEAGPYSAEDAKAKGLIDDVGQVKDAQSAILAKAGGGATLVEFADYDGVEPKASGILDGAKIAVISAEGDIMTGQGDGPNPLGGGDTILSDDVSKAFYDAIDDKAVKAIVFRISSPGGSDTASEQILSAVRAAKAAGKPVIVSMGTYGASGGYWIASEASQIIAEPTTLTGSIGVFGGKFALGPALAQFGVDARSLKVGGDYADAFGTAAPMNPTQKAAFSAWMDRIYNGFVARVAAGRHLPEDRVREIAKGRVWTGAQARGLGLVDDVGGFYLAVDRAKALAGIKGDARLETFGGVASPFQAIQRMFGVGAQAARLMSAAIALADDPQARGLINDARDARLRADGATVLAPSLVH
jgi:protease-4